MIEITQFFGKMFMEVAVRTKLLGAFALLMALSTNTLANDEVTTYLTNQLSDATLAYEDALERCEAKASLPKKITLPVSKLFKAQITLQELHGALSYFRDQAELACIGNTRLKLMSAILDLNSFTRAHPETPINPIQSGLALVLPSPQQLEARAIYSRLSPNKVQLLDSIFKGTSPTLANISNWQGAASALRKDQTSNVGNQANESLR